MSSRHPMDRGDDTVPPPQGDPTYFDPLGLSLNFFHKRLLKGAVGFLTGGPIGGITGLLSGGNGNGRPIAIPLGPCADASLRRDAQGRCVSVAVRLPEQRQPARFTVTPEAFLPGGAPLIERQTAQVPMIGASAVTPMRTTQVVRRCQRGAVLAIDGLCYDKKLLRKDQREWPPGRKPLLTGGDLNAISRAARAAGRMKTQQKRLQKLGLLPKPTTQRRIAPVAHHHHE